LIVPGSRTAIVRNRLDTPVLRRMTEARISAKRDGGRASGPLFSGRPSTTKGLATLLPARVDLRARADYRVRADGSLTLNLEFEFHDRYDWDPANGVVSDRLAHLLARRGMAAEFDVRGLWHETVQHPL